MHQRTLSYPAGLVAGRLTAGIGLLLVVLSLTGCGMFRDRGRDLLIDEITLNINSIAHEGTGEQNQWGTVCKLLNRYAEFDCQNVRRTNCQQVGSIRVCDYDSVTLTFKPPLSLAMLRRLHGELLALEKEGVTLGLKTGSLTARYVGLTAEGSISIKVRIAVTPGATLFLERRWEGICEQVETVDNVFDGEISLRKAQEWVFYRTEVKTGSDLVQRYFRLNIITKNSEELSREDFDRLISRP